MPVGRRAGVNRPLDPAEWEERFTGSEREGLRERLLRQVAYSSPLNADYILRDQDLELAHARYLEILEGEGRWLLTRDWGLQPYVHRLG
jgi:hypothetical protein